MNFRDIAPEIAAISKKYTYKNPPDLLIAIQEGIGKVLRWLADLLASFKIHVPGFADTPMVGNVMQILIFVVGALSLGAILWLVWRRMGELHAQRDLARGGQFAAQINLNAAGWKKEAASLASASEWKEACRALYMSCLRLLHEGSIIEFAPTRTNFEYWYALSPRNHLIAITFKELANSIEMIWFGNKNATNNDYLECLDCLEKIETECASMSQDGSKALGVMAK